MNIQKGFAHIFLIVGLMTLIIGVLSVVLWKNYLDTDLLSTEEPTSSPQEVTYKEHVSVTGSGLAFTYPDSWILLTSDEVAAHSNGDKSAHSSLYSQELNEKSKQPEILTDHVCVTLSEFSGEWPRSYGPPNSEATNFEFNIGENTVGLINHEDSSKGYFSASLVSVDPFERGASYIALKNNYFLKATAKKNCRPGDNPRQRDTAIDIEQAKAILKSVKLVD